MQRQQLQNSRKESPCDEPEVVLCRRAVPQIAQGPSGGLELSPEGALKVCFSPQTKPAYLQRGTPETSARPAERKRDTAAPGPPGGAAHQRKASLPQQAAERAPSSRSCLWVPTGCGLRTPPLVLAGCVLFSPGHTRTPRQILPLGFKTGHCHGWKFLDLV